MKKKLLGLAIVLALVAAMIVPTAVYAGDSSSVGGTLAITLVSIAVTPNPATAIVVAPGYANPTTEQFTATGTYSNGSTANITNTVNWNSSNNAAATISSTGLATSVAAGQTNITASGSSVTSPAIALSVNAPPTSVDSAATLVTPT
jgi:cytoskeletal protein RodZ